MAYSAIGAVAPTCITDAQRTQFTTDCRMASIAGLSGMPYTSGAYTGLDPCMLKDLPACPIQFRAAFLAPTVAVCDNTMQGILNWFLGKCPTAPTCVPDALFDAIGLVIGNEAKVLAWKAGAPCPIAGIDCAAAQAILAQPAKWNILKVLPSCTGRVRGPRLRAAPPKRAATPVPTEAAVTRGGFGGAGILLLVALGAGGVWWWMRRKKAA